MQVGHMSEDILLSDQTEEKAGYVFNLLSRYRVLPPQVARDFLDLVAKDLESTSFTFNTQSAADIAAWGRTGLALFAATSDRKALLKTCDNAINGVMTQVAADLKRGVPTLAVD